MHSLVEVQNQLSFEKLAEEKAKGKILDFDSSDRLVALSTCQDVESMDRTVVLATIS